MILESMFNFFSFEPCVKGWENDEREKCNGAGEAPAMPEAVEPLAEIVSEKVLFTAVELHIAEILLEIARFAQGVAWEW